MADIETVGILEEIEALVSDKLQLVTAIAFPFTICIVFFLSSNIWFCFRYPFTYFFQVHAISSEGLVSAINSCVRK